MKRFFTLLFGIVAMSFAAHAGEPTLVDQCINVLLGNEQPTTLMATNLDANHDGAITIDDVTTLIDMALARQTVNRAPSLKSFKINPAIIEKRRIKESQKTAAQETTDAAVKQASKKE